jgi:hypothetical protein
VWIEATAARLLETSRQELELMLVNIPSSSTTTTSSSSSWRQLVFDPIRSLFVKSCIQGRRRVAGTCVDLFGGMLNLRTLGVR